MKSTLFIVTPNFSMQKSESFNWFVKDKDKTYQVQAGNNIDQLAKIASFDLFGKMVFAADTLLRYRVNKNHKYQTCNIGIFNFEEHSLELHEFKRIDL